MPRANRHFLAGYVWHITHRCHKREFLLKFAKDRERWLRWLFEARRRYKLVILNYAVTSNHIHLLVADRGGRDAIVRSMQLVAGRTAQAYNARKQRKGSFWEDRYHATAVETGRHLSQCLVYIDLNMVRAGVVEHPSQWPFGGYNEIQQPRRKCKLIAYEQLRDLLGFATYDQLRASHRLWVEEAIRNGDLSRDDRWSRSVAVGTEQFVNKVKGELSFRTKGRGVRQADGVFELRETTTVYRALLGCKKGDMEPKDPSVCSNQLGKAGR